MSSLAPNDRLGHYEIERILGAGGMGVVYRAFDTRLQRPVAIKLINPTDQFDVSRRILSEARAASALNHFNICTIHEVAEHGDRSFIVMEYIEGRPLSDVIAEGPAPQQRVLELALQVVGALAHAHERNVVHGDLKAANVLVSEGDRIKVVDFGLARRHAVVETGVTDTGLTGGTPYAMAPELLRGARPDARSDVWALGVLLQELASGTRPFTRPTVAELVAAILGESPTPPPSHVAPALRRIIDRCLTRDPMRRYQRAGELLAALDAISDSRTPVLRSDEDDGAWIVPAPPALTALGASQIVLIGREQEWGLLRAAWERATTGQRQLALVAGEPGIGKTRLVMDFARSVGHEANVLFGRCDQEALVPHQPFVEALEWYLRECPPAVLEARLAEVDGIWELAQLISPLARRVSLVPAPVESNPEGRRYRLFEAVAALVSAIARGRPLLMVLEDLHWADRPTLLLLRHLLRSSHQASLAIVATYRETELGRTHPLAEMLAELRREEGVTRIGLHGLKEEDVSQFIGEWIGHESPAALTHLVAGKTEGNPFFVSEVLRHLSETGALATLTSGTRAPSDPGGLPEGVREVIGRRLSRLSDACNRVLGLAAVVGREFNLTVLNALAELPEERLLDILDEALAARLIQDVPVAPDRYAFTHALVRDTLYGELTAARRTRLHRVVAEAIERLAPSDNPPLADLAYHYAQVASPAVADKAIAYAIRAAERAASAFALEEAARFYHVALQALDLLPQEPGLKPRRLDLHFRRGRAFADVGLWGPARTELEAALELVDPAESTRRTQLLLELSKCSFWLLDTPAVRRNASEALTLSESLGRDDLAADAMSWLGGALNAEGDVFGAVAMDRQALARAGSPRTFGLARSVITLYHAGLIDEALQSAVPAVEHARASQDPTFRVHALQHLAISLSAAGRYAEALRAFEEMRDFGRRHGVLPMLARGISMSAVVHVALGDYARGEEIANEARELAQRVSFPPAFVSAGIDLLTVLARAHEPGRAEAIFDDVARAVVAGSGWHGWLWRLRLSQARAELALERGDWQAAIAAATDAIADGHARPRPKYEALGLVTRARAKKAIDDVPGAIVDASCGVEIARRFGDPALLLKALAVQIDVDGSDALVSEARACSDRILSQLDDARLRERFLGSELSDVVAKAR
jgi:tetratricopeptide (TPR) repeat protein/predicted Ser/Thr protein kinase